MSGRGHRLSWDFGTHAVVVMQPSPSAHRHLGVQDLAFVYMA